MKKLIALPLLGLLLIPALPAEAQSGRGNDRSIEKKLDMILRRLEMLEQRVNRSDGGPNRRMKQRAKDAPHEHGNSDHRRGPDDRRRGPMGFGTGPQAGQQGGRRRGPPAGAQFGPQAGGRRGPPANAQFGPQAMGKLPEIMRAAMQGDVRAQKMLGMLHKKIGNVLRASKQKHAKKNAGHQAPRIRIARVGSGGPKDARYEVLEVEVDRRRVQLELAKRDLTKREMDRNARKRAQKQMKKTGPKKVTDRDVQRMRELTKKSRQLQEEIRRLRAELSQMK